MYVCVCMGSRWHSGKESTCQCRRCKRYGFDIWLGKIPWVRNGNPPQYSCLGDPMDRGGWQTTVYGVAKSWTWLKWLSMYTHLFHLTLDSRTTGFEFITSWVGLPRWLSGKELPAMQETQVQSLGREDPLEKEMATHSSIHAWKISWTEEPGRLQS